nr:type I toxin-antitoxin system Ibs family toxin [Escherichia coli]
MVIILIVLLLVSFQAY